jgi:uncharacterized protein
MVKDSIEDIRDFLAQKRIAVVGASRNKNDFNTRLFLSLRELGYDVVPVNPKASEVGGIRSFDCVQAIDPPADAALLLTPANTTTTIVADCLEAGIRRVWMYRSHGTGASNPAAVDFCRKNGITVIAGQCPYMFLPQTGWFHQFHGLIKKWTGSYPQSS